MKKILIYFTLLAIFCYRLQAQNIQLSGLNNAQGVIISNPDDPLSFGTVNYAGDINGDGLKDVLVWSDFNLYLIYGTNGSSSEISLSTLTPAQGIVIGDSANIAFTGTGDVNGDNIGDLLILNAQDYSSCVIFGNKNGLQDMNLTDCSNGTFGIEISGCPVNYTNYTGCGSGSTLSGAGDINGDGLQDILIGSFMVGPTGLPAAGMVYVVFGNKNGLSNINLTNLDNAQGFSIMGSAEQSYLGLHISKAGDVNGDGIDDIILGSYYKFDAYVIYGTTSGFSNIDLNNFDPSQGFTISIANSSVQMIVSDAGDFNGDGIGDLLIGLYGGAGGAYVVYGGTDIPFNINLTQLSASQGLLIVTPDTTSFGQYVSSLGDFNQDGLDDVVISADQDENNAGAGYVIFGTKSAPANITVATLTSTQGLVIIGGPNEEVGDTVSGLGDFNGDNIPDLALGTNSQSAAGYVVYSPFSGSGPNPPTPPPKSAERMGCTALVASIVAFILCML